jgi:hypothetical protein
MKACKWCQTPITGRKTYCSRRCRQSAYRFRRRLNLEATYSEPMHLAYADPPYPGLARKYYRHEDNYAGEVDHRCLLEHLTTFDGWALSTSSEALRDVLPMCPNGVLVRPWVKPNHIAKWEPVVFRPARPSWEHVGDYLCAQPARHGGDLIGRKPIAFCAWLFGLLGASPYDTFDDLFPGTGIVSSAWREFASSADDKSLGAVVDIGSKSHTVAAVPRRHLKKLPGVGQ